MSRSEKPLLSIGSVVRRTGVSVASLRAWERRYGFPRPQRAASGHRRYELADVEAILGVLAERERGADLATAIARVANPVPAQPSFFAHLRATRPEIDPQRVGPRQMLALCRAIEDESLSRAEPSLLIGGFQRELRYRRSEERWRVLGEAAAEAIVFADFERVREPDDGPLEVPLDGSDPAVREWFLICMAPGHAACAVAWEPPREGTAGNRVLELIIALDPAAVREAAGVALPLLAAAPARAKALARELATMPSPPAAAQLQLSAAIIARTVARLEGFG